MSIEETIRNEQSLLRGELQQLKQCQLRYFMLSVGGSGLLISIPEIVTQSPVRHYFLLIPLIIVLPCWWTFFDKATTITRLVGYMRILEEQLSNINTKEPMYIGYENALSKFRKAEDTLISNQEENKTLTRRGEHSIRHRYWIINWFTFLTISLLCCVLPLITGYQDIHLMSITSLPIGIAFIFVIFTAVYTYSIMKSVRYGKYSYDNVTDFWKNNVLSDLYQT